MNELYNKIMSSCCADGDGEDWVAIDHDKLKALIAEHDAALLESVADDWRNKMTWDQWSRVTGANQLDARAMLLRRGADRIRQQTLENNHEQQ